MFKTIRRFYWVISKFLSRHLKVIGRTTLFMLLGIMVFFFFANYLPTPKDTRKIGRVGKFSLETIPPDIQARLSIGLVELDEMGNPQPALARSWEVNAEGTVYTFTLEENAKWSDGSRVTGKDISYNFSDVGIDAQENKVVYTLKEPFAPFYTAVTRPILKNHQIGTSESIITNFKQSGGGLQTLTVDKGASRFIYKFYPTEAAALIAYRLGEISQLEGISTAPADLENDQTTIISKDENSEKIAAIFMNNQDNLLSSKSTRQGLAYAIKDKESGSERAISPISKNSWAYNDLVKTYDFDAAHARELFNQDINDPATVNLELKTMLPYLDVAEKIAEDWHEVLGVKVDVKVVSNLTNDYQMILADYTPPLDPDQYTIWHSTQPTNFTHFNNLKIDKLLEDGRRTLDQKLRKSIYEDFQRFLLEDCPAVFLFDTSTYTLSRKPLI